MHGGYILIRDTQGCKYDGMLKSALKNIIGNRPYSYKNIIRGELLDAIKSEDGFNFALHLDPTVHLYCGEEEVAPLSMDEFLLMEGIQMIGDRLKAFTEGRLQFGLNLMKGSMVYVDVSGPNPAQRDYVVAAINFRGKVGDLPGITFGVEILVRMVSNNVLMFFMFLVNFFRRKIASVVLQMVHFKESVTSHVLRAMDCLYL